ncbi:hypothetical protein [Sphingobium sp.]|uniref:hypothetical protein n=1 Tax=Sphingobium sp. TaxID=1912891 RepID=UPI0025FDD7CA|nr:hypothetical protein [Sphingobium sp.]
MKGSKQISSETTDPDQLVLREIVRLLARQAAAEHVRSIAQRAEDAEGTVR